MKHNRPLETCASPCDFEGARVSTPLGFCRYIWALASALAPSGKESPRENEDPVFYLVKKYYS